MCILKQPEFPTYNSVTLLTCVQAACIDNVVDSFSAKNQSLQPTFKKKQNFDVIKKIALGYTFFPSKLIFLFIEIVL